MFRPAESECETAETAAGSVESDGCSLPSLPIARATAVPGMPKANAYGRSFWLSYLSLTSLMIAVSLMYRYADFITFLGGTELELGVVVGVGMIGSLAMRLAQGVGIDRYGPRHIWLGSTALFVASMLGHLLVSRPDGAAIYLMQVLFRTSVAGVFGAAFTFAFQQVPISRMTEAIGTVGTASFVGIVVGPRIGDMIAAGDVRTVQRGELDWLFLVAAAFGCVSFVAAWFATSRELRPRRRARLPIIPVLRRYHPGMLMGIGIVTGIALGMPATFLRTIAAELQINRLAPFFTAYALTAIATRLATRRLAEDLGVRGGILIGMILVVAGVLSYLVVSAEWQLLIPAVLTGAGQAILYPAVVAGGSAAFPNHCRGVGTTLMLATIDLGTLIGAPLIGGIVYYCKLFGLPGYPAMFLAIAAILVASGAYYALSTRSRELPGND
jgi:MFS family permease